MPKVHLRNFAETGAFGSVAVGCSREELAKAFGDVEFHFSPDAEVLWLIHIDTFSREAYPEGPGNLTLDPWIFRRGASLSEILDGLKSVDMDVTKYADPAAPDSPDLLTVAASKLELRFAKPSIWSVEGLSAISLPYIAQCR